VYARVCALIAIGPDKFGTPLAMRDKIVSVKDLPIHFRVLALPTLIPIKTVHVNFQDLLFTQV